MRSCSLVKNGVDLHGIWYQSSGIQSLIFQHHLSPVLEGHTIFLLTFFPSPCALSSMALCIVGIQAENLKCMFSFVCVTQHGENEHELLVLHMHTFLNAFVEYCVFPLKALNLFLREFDLCRALHFVQLGKQSYKFIIVALFITQ